MQTFALTCRLPYLLLKYIHILMDNPPPLPPPVSSTKCERDNSFAFWFKISLQIKDTRRRLTILKTSKTVNEVMCFDK